MGESNLWIIVGIVGGCVFYGRFYLQWIVSERAGKSVIPTGFWYMSCVGSMLLLPYALASHSPLGALSQCFNLMVYARNLVHIGRRSKKLSPVADRAIHIVVILITVVAVFFVAKLWLGEISASQALPAATIHHTWFWLAIGLTGQALFASRFLIQWIATERSKESVVPPVFWSISLLAATLQTTCFAQRQEWVFAAGMAATILIYVRNIVLIRPHATQGVPG